MMNIPSQHVGSIALADLDSICRAQGRDGLPFPFFTPLPSGSETTELAESIDAADIAAALWSWAQAWTHADIWVDSRVGHTDETVASRRIAACRVGDIGYLGIQRPDEPVVDAHTLSAYDLGAAIADHVGFTKAGSRPRITIPGYAGSIPGSSRLLNRSNAADFGDDEFVSGAPLLVSHQVSVRSSVTAVPDVDVTATGVVQSRHKPARYWGIDWSAALATWVQIADDGDYLYVPDHSHATPTTTNELAARINQLIAADVAALRQLRGI